MSLPKPARVAEVLTEGKPAIIEDVINSLRAHLPTYGEHVDQRHRNVGDAVFITLMHMMRGAPLELIDDNVRELVADLSRDGKIEPADWVVRTHVYLPACRRYLVQQLGAERGLEYYEVAERAALAALYPLTRAVLAP